jgi:hypothetical protein
VKNFRVEKFAENRLVCAMGTGQFEYVINWQIRLFDFADPRHEGPLRVPITARRSLAMLFSWTGTTAITPPPIE